MEELREQLGISFEELEWLLKKEFDQRFGETVRLALEELDRWVYENRDAKRYVSKGFRARTIETVMGISLTYERRYYFDIITRKHVALLDEVLGIPKYEQVSPILAELAVMLGVSGPSYRAAADHLANSQGKRVISHERIRQAVISVGEELGKEEELGRENPNGTRQVDVLWIEADGAYMHLQRQGRSKRIEEKVIVTHEGWQKRHPGSKEYRLKNVKIFSSHDAEDFWEEASRWVLSHYDIRENTVVVINGDRAEWIRQGVDYFPRAIYQVDRFHLKRELRRLFEKRDLGELFAAMETDVTGATFLACLAKYGKHLRGRQEVEELRKLLKDLATMPEGVVDYRVRLRELGFDTTGMNGMGAAEAQIDRISDRVKRRGQSWSLRGLKAIMLLTCKRFEGCLEDVVSRLSRLRIPDGGLLAKSVLSAQQAAEAVLTNTLGLRAVHPPIMDSGRTRSGGLSTFFHQLSSSCTI